MANEDKKDFNAMLNNSKDMPKIIELESEEAIRRYGGKRMLLAPPLEYDGLMRQVPEGKLATSAILRDTLARRYHADFTCPLTAGIFISIAAWASYQRKENPTPYWRTIKADGELNSKFPGGTEAQKALLESEGHTIIQKGRSSVKYYVADYQCSLVTF